MNKDRRQYFASIYVREQGDSRVRHCAGPFPLDRAREVIDIFVAEDLADDVEPAMYYELRGLTGCPVRYRVWIERPAPYARVELLTGRRDPGRHTFSSQGN